MDAAILTRLLSDFSVVLLIVSDGCGGCCWQPDELTLVLVTAPKTLRLLPALTGCDGLAEVMAAALARVAADMRSPAAPLDGKEFSSVALERVAARRVLVACLGQFL